MKNLKKILICLSLVCCLSLGVSCGSNGGDNEENSQNNSSADNVTDSDISNDDNSIQVTDEQGNTIDVTTSNGDGDGSTDDAQSYVTDDSGNVVTDANGNAFVTEAVTDASGNVVTDDSGNTVTQKVAVTTTNGNNNDANNSTTTVAPNGDNNAVATTVANNNATTNANADNNANNNATTTVAGQQTNAVLTVTQENNVVATTTADTGLYFAKNRYSTFIWMSEDSLNRYGSEAFAEVTFKVLDNAKTGTYPVELSYMDMCNENVEMVNFSAMNGTITVGNENSVVAQGPASSGAVVRMDNGFAKPGDTVKLKLYLDNNPGVAIFQMDIKYDNNALEVQSITPTGMFANDTIDSNLNINIASN